MNLPQALDIVQNHIRIGKGMELDNGVPEALEMVVEELANRKQRTIELMKLEYENAALRADNAALWEVTAESFQAFSVALEEARGEDWPEIRKLRDKCQQALSILHPGDSLLKELASLRTVRKAAQAIISQIDTECDGECQDIAYMKLELALRNALAAVTGGKE